MRIPSILHRSGPLILLSAALLATMQSAGQPASSSQTWSTGLAKSIYLSRCAPCHGESGKGDGPNATMLSPRPRDFTAGVYAYRTTESGSIPVDEDILRTIRNGLPGTAMPSWGKFITGDSLAVLLAYVKAFSSRFQEEKPKPVMVGAVVSPTAAGVAVGRKEYDKLQCASCHGEDGAGRGTSATEFQDAAGYPMRAANLTEPWTFHGGSAARDIYLRFRTGVDGSPMPSYVGAATDREMWDLANYVVSIRRKPVWEMDSGEVARFYATTDTAAGRDPATWGRYLVRSLGCADCHTPTNGRGGYLEEFSMAGGQRWNLGPFGEIVSYNLTSDKETGLGGWTDDQIRKVLTKGTRRDGSRMLPFPMPWTAYADLKDSDLNAVIAYLRTLPPVRNDIPTPRSLAFFPYLWAKFRMLILGDTVPVYIYAENAGSAQSAGPAPEHGVVPKEEHP